MTVTRITFIHQNSPITPTNPTFTKDAATLSILIVMLIYWHNKLSPNRRHALALNYIKSITTLFCFPIRRKSSNLN